MVLAKQAGADPLKFIRGTDLSDGSACGYNNQTNNPYLAWPNPVDPLYIYNTICVPTCDATNNYGSSAGSFGGVLTRMVYRYNTTQVGYYCAPTAQALALIPSVQLSWQSGSVTNLISQAVADVTTSWIGILVATACSIIVTFLFISFMGKCAGCLVLTGIVLVLGACSLLAAFLITFGNNSTNKEVEPSYAQAALIIGYIIAGLIFILLCVLLALYTRIRIAIEVVKEAAHAVGDMKCIICFPIYPLLAALCYIVVLALSIVYVWSVTTLSIAPTPSGLSQTAAIPSSMWAAGSFANGNPAFYYSTSRSNFWYGLTAYLVFHGLWQIQFFFYFGYLTFAGATADWYFTDRYPPGHPDEVFFSFVLHILSTCYLMFFFFFFFFFNLFIIL